MVNQFGFSRNDSTSTKGRKAVEVVKYVFKKKPELFGADEFTEISFKDARLDGIDGVLTFNGKRKVIPVQVKLRFFRQEKGSVAVQGACSFK